MQPTAYTELNAMLNDFVTSVQAILGDNFLAAYLVGSFATGDWDEYGDVDFVVVKINMNGFGTKLTLLTLRQRCGLFSMRLI